jgi:hypothetical protein
MSSKTAVPGSTSTSPMSCSSCSSNTCTLQPASARTSGTRRLIGVSGGASRVGVSVL